MATYYARKAGNINAADVWATTPSGTAAAVTFAAGDVLVANSFAITVNVSVSLGDTGQVRNDTTGGASTGGSFTLSDGVTLTANMVQGQVTGGSTIVAYAGSLPNSASIVGNASSVNTSGNANVIQFTGSGTLNFTGNLTGDASSAGQTNATLLVSGSGVLNFTGNNTGGSGGTTAGAGIHISSSTATININGNCFGGTGIAPGVRNAGAATVNINGIAAGAPATGTGAGVLNASTGIVNLKRARGNAYGPGNSSGIAAAVGAANSGLGVIQIEELEYGTFGMSPTSGTGIRLKKLGSNVAIFNYCDTAGAKTLIDATQNAAMPAATDVRSGVSYVSGAQTGSCAVPSAGSVALGVAVDAGFGTAVLTPEAVWGHSNRTLTAGAGISASDVWDYATRSLTTSSGPTAVQIRQEMDSNSTKLANLDATVSSRLAPSGTLATVTTLTNAPTVPTPSQIASQVRSELSVELNRLDTNVGSRAASGTLASDVTAIKAKTDSLNVDRVNNTATLSQVGNLLAQANS